MANVFGMRSRNATRYLADGFGECIWRMRSHDCFEKLRCVLDGTHCMVYITATSFYKMIYLHFFDMSDQLYLTYIFDSDGRPSKTCHVANRSQAIPSRHRISIVIDGKELVSKQHGHILTKEGKSSQRNLPIQKTVGLDPLMGMSIDAEPTANLPKRVWKQYDRIRILFERLGTFYAARDNMYDHSVNIYRPIRLVL